MIKVILSGGLGNQMFEYAAGKALSKKKNSSLQLDTYTLIKKTSATKRTFELDIFDIEATISTSIINKIAVKVFGSIKSKKTGFLFLRTLGIFRDEKAEIYDEKFKRLSKNAILFGYFQNENYFRDISQQLKKDFTFKHPLNDKNSIIRYQIEQSSSVSIHIRRGDYANNNSNLLILDISYYKNAIEHILSKIENPHFFIFSDGIEWVKDNLELSSYNHTFIDWNKKEDSYIDMQLMSLCKHNIIANSSFSWWGAWLNNNPSKIVLAPQKWYKSDIGIYPDGFLPETWITL